MMASRTVASEKPRRRLPKIALYPPLPPSPLESWWLPVMGFGSTWTLQPACPDALSIFFNNFSNIHGLHSNFYFAEHRLSSSRPHFLFVTETQMFERSENKPNS